MKNTKLALAAILGAWLLLCSTGNAVRAASQGADSPLLLTTAAATTPQMPLWRAIETSGVPALSGLRVQYWKNLDDLRGAVLAGRGDIWLGHVEGFAQAALRGAPVRLLAVTGWRKFQILTTRHGAATVDDLAGPDGVVNLAVTPPQSPAIPVLRHIEGRGAPRIAFTPLEPRQLMLEAVRGKIMNMLAPEPLATVLLGKVPGLRILASVEDMYGKAEDGPARLPIAAVAIRAGLEESHPGLAAKLLDAMLEAGTELAASPELGVAALPKEFERFISKDVVRRSLERDMILVRAARDCRVAINRYLSLVMPGKADGLPDTFYWDGR